MNIKQRVSKAAKKRWSQLKAARYERQQERKRLAAIRKRAEAEEKEKFEEWKVKESFRKKREAVQKGGLGAGGLLGKIGDFGMNVNKNVMRELGYPTPARSTKKKRRKKKRKRKR